MIGRAAEPLMTSQQSTDSGEVSVLSRMARTLALAPTVPPPGSKQLPRSIDAAFGTKADTVPRLLATLEPPLAERVLHRVEEPAAAA